MRTLTPFVLLSVTLLFTAGGCTDAGPQRVAVSGLVMFDGTPVEQGTIAFVPTAANAKQPGAGGPITAGEYAIPAETGPAAGKYRVEIRWSKPTGKQIEQGSPAPPGTLVDEVKEAIPAKYNVRSTLEKEIDAGENSIHFDLTS